MLKVARKMTCNSCQIQTLSQSKSSFLETQQRSILGVTIDEHGFVAICGSRCLLSHWYLSSCGSQSRLSIRVISLWLPYSQFLFAHWTNWSLTDSQYSTLLLIVLSNQVIGQRRHRVGVILVTSAKKKSLQFLLSILYSSTSIIEWAVQIKARGA